MKPLVIFMLATGFLGLGTRRVFAQTDFSGTWALDRDITH
jgi:hypothetical protein